MGMCWLTLSFNVALSSAPLVPARGAFLMPDAPTVIPLQPPAQAPFDDLLGRTLLLPPQENEETLRAKIIAHVTHFENDQQAQGQQLINKVS